MEALLELEPDKYQALLRRSPLKRAKRHGLLRNAAVVAGNRAERSLVPALARIMRDEEQAIARSHAAWALGRVGGKHAEHALQDALALEKDGEVLEEIRLALDELS